MAPTTTAPTNDLCLGDRVWIDLNGNGRQDAGEPGINGVGIAATSLGADGALGGGDDQTFTTQTTGDGDWFIDNLPAGTYTVVVGGGIPAGLVASYDADGGTANPDGRSTIDLIDCNEDQDFGYRYNSSIGDTIYLDLNGNGSQDAGEPGVPNQLVQLVTPGPDGILGTGDDVTLSTRTDGSGTYSFTNLPDGDYIVNVVGGIATDGINSDDPDGGTPNSSKVTLAGADDLGQDFGYTGDNIIGDTVWNDVDEDGIDDGAATEPRLPNVKVTITWLGPGRAVGGGDDVRIGVFTTGSDGTYLATKLPDGRFSVVVTGGVPAGLVITYDPQGTTNPDGASTVTVSGGGANYDQDFGYAGTPVLTGSIGDTVYRDTNGDGAQGDPAAEPGIDGVTVTLRAPGPDGQFDTGDDVLATDVTGNGGTYLFENLPAGAYRVEVSTSTVPAGLVNTDDEDGNLDSRTPVTLGAGEDHLTADFGYDQPTAAVGSIGDRIYLDTNGNGSQDAGEPGIGGVTVTLIGAGPDGQFGTADDTTATTTTDDNGAYIFKGLPAGNYRVTVTGGLPAGVDNTGDPDGGNDSTSELTLAAGQNDLDQDFGYDADSLLGDRVWLDVDRDGVQDPAETGINGVEVTATFAGPDKTFGTADDVVATQITAGDGDYLFDALTDGMYRVTVTDGVPAGLVPTFDADSGTNNPDETSKLTLTTANLQQDFGYYRPGSIGDTIFLDKNANGIQDPGEPGLRGVTVTLTGPGPDGIVGTPDDTTTTDITDLDGTYLFDNLPAGPHRVTVTGGLPGGLDNTGDPDGGNDSTSLVILAPGQSDLDQDFGYKALSLLGDRVWLDLDRDGVQDAGEPGINGVVVTAVFAGGDGIFGNTDDAQATATTSGDGDYLFTDVPDGTYMLTVTSGVPAGLTPTFDADSGTTNPDETSKVTLATANLLQDFGYIGNGSIGDTIYSDTNGNGIQDPGEAGIGGVGVTVTFAGPDNVFGTPDDIVVKATTDGNGIYSVAGLPAGAYTVVVDPATLPAGVQPTQDPDGGGDSKSALTLAPGENNDGQDFGYQGTGSIGDTVFLDTDGNGTQDAGDPGVAGVTVTLTGPGPDGTLGTPDDTTTTDVTDANGEYLFEGLPAGTYQVEVTGGLPAGLDNTADPDGGADSTSTVPLGAGEQNLDQDFGYEAASLLGDRVWLDLDRDGVQDAGEPGINGVVVTLVFAGPDAAFGTTDDVTSTTTTSGDGGYLFSDIFDGEYMITVTSGVPDGLQPTFDADSGTTNPDQTTKLTLVTADLQQDFGYVGTGSIGDTVFEDNNVNGVQDDPATEPGVGGVKVTVTGAGQDGVFGTPDDIVVMTTTDGNGTYRAEGLPAGEYVVAVDQTTLPTGSTLVSDPDGVDNPDGSSAVTLDTGDDILDQDFGVTALGSIGDTIYLDRNGDGTQGAPASEPGIEGVTVVLTGAGPDGVFGTPDDISRTTTTGDTGMYLFDGLPAGDYRVEVTGGLPGSVQNTADPDGTPGGTGDSKSALTLAPGEDNLDQDFGYNTLSLLGDRVWWDFDRDGVQDPGEPGMNGVVVKIRYFGRDNLENTPDDIVFTRTTGGDGDYLVAGIPDGMYRVMVDSGVPAGFDATFDNDSGTATPDEMSLVSLIAADLDQDFGYAGSASIGDTIYLDRDSNGTQGDPADEPGLAGVTVTLTSPGADGIAGTPDDISLTTTTGADGSYQFNGLPAGTYTVTVDPTGVPAGVVNTGDPDAAPGTPGDSMSTITVAAGETNLDQDFGYGPNSRIGDRVWLDANRNGVQDDGEAGINDVEVTVTFLGPDGSLGGGDDIVFVTQTAGDGDYLVDNIPDGAYIVAVTGGVPTGFDPTFDADSGIVAPDGTSATQLTTEDRNQDFGFAPKSSVGTGSIGDNVWLDLDGDGVRDLGEPGLEGATVTLTWLGPDGVVSADDVVYTTTVDDAGNYLFENLPDGNFTVAITGLPNGLTATADPDGGGDAASALTLAPGETNLAQDFGFTGGAAVGDSIWIDTTCNGVRDGLEPGLPGIPVTVMSAGVDGVLGTADDIVVVTVTDAAGRYDVSGLPAGPTKVSYQIADLPTGFSPISDLDGAANTRAVTVVDLVAGTPNRDVDFAVGGSGTLSGVVFEDINGNGVQDPGERGLPGVTVLVTYRGPDGPVVIPVVTGANGEWVLECLPSGPYVIDIDPATVPPGVVASIPPTNVTVPDSGRPTEVDIPAVASATVTGQVWNDIDRDGVQDPGEVGIPGVRVTLYGADGTVVATTVTVTGGGYTFANVVPGNYRVVIDPTTLPAGVTPSFEIDGTRDGSVSITVAPGADVKNIDFGFGPTPTPTPTPVLPGTGADTLTVLLLAMGLLLAGLFMVYGRKRPGSDLGIS